MKKDITMDAKCAYINDLKRFDGLLDSASTSDDDVFSLIFYQCLATWYLQRDYTHQDVLNQEFTEDYELFDVDQNMDIVPLAEQLVAEFNIYLVDDEEANYCLAGGKRHYFILSAK